MKKRLPKNITWEFRSHDNPKSSCQIGFDGLEWFAGPLPVHPLVLLAENLTMMVGTKPGQHTLHQWTGRDGAKVKCADVLDERVVAVIERLIVKCKRDYEANPSPTHEYKGTEYKSIWDD